MIERLENMDNSYEEESTSSTYALFPSPNSIGAYCGSRPSTVNSNFMIYARDPIPTRIHVPSHQYQELQRPRHVVHRQFMKTFRRFKIFNIFMISVNLILLGLIGLSVALYTSGVTPFFGEMGLPDKPARPDENHLNICMDCQEPIVMKADLNNNSGKCCFRNMKQLLTVISDVSTVRFANIILLCVSVTRKFK